MNGVDLSSLIDMSGGQDDSLEFVAERTDFGRSVEISFRFLVNGEQFRGRLATLPASSISKIHSALGPLVKKD